MFQTRSLAILLAFFLGSMGASFLLFHPTIRDYTQDLFYPSHREVLSLLRTDFYGKPYKILKIRTQQIIFLEVYEWDDKKANFILADRARLTDSKDAYYQFDEKKSNLFLKDINQDTFPEIIIPSFDRNMVAHLNIYSYDVDNRKLVKLSNH